MILQPSIFLSTNNDKVTIPDLPDFKDKNDLASKHELETTKTQITEYINDFVAYQSQVEQQLQILTTKIDNIKKETLQSIYKVGDIIHTTNSENPSVKFGGTWEQYAQGRVLLGVGTFTDNKETKTFNVYDNGGEYNYTLNEKEMPSHRHSISRPYGNLGSVYDAEVDGHAITDENLVLYTDYTGGDPDNDDATMPHGNMQPYIAVYIWRKIA